jgi:hypothetical protein
MDSDIDYVREPHNLSIGDAVEVYKRDAPEKKYKGIVYRILTKDLNSEYANDNDNNEPTNDLVDFIYVKFTNETYNDILKHGSSVVLEWLTAVPSVNSLLPNSTSSPPLYDFVLTDKISVLTDIVRNDEPGEIESFCIHHIHSLPFKFDMRYTLDQIYGVLICRKTYNIVLAEQSDETNDTDIVPTVPVLRKRPMTRGYARQLYLEANPPIDSEDSEESDNEDEDDEDDNSLMDDDDSKYNIYKLLFDKIDSIVVKIENSEIFILLCWSILVSILLPALISLMLNQTDNDYENDVFEPYDDNFPETMAISSLALQRNLINSVVGAKKIGDKLYSLPSLYRMNPENPVCEM